jgi:RimJ/RimL family protein N-acetyltransferase/SAM-dependent methyltransferase
MSDSETFSFDLRPTNLKNELITLVPLSPHDFESLYAVASDPLVWEQHPTKNRYQRDVFEKFFEGAIESKGAFLVLDTKTNEVIGSSRFYDPDEKAGSVHIGYTFLGRAFWGKGYNQALKIIMINHAFKFVNKILFQIGTGNIRSQKAIAKFGAIKIGEAEVTYSGEPNANNNYLYEITRESWINFINKNTDRYKTTFETWNRVADLYHEKFSGMDLYNDTYDLFCDSVEKKSAKVLEIGCGPGNITKYLLTKRPGFKITATDVAPNMVKLAKENNQIADCRIMDCRELDKLTEKFDAVVCGFCLPYLSKDDCAKLVKDCTSLLNEKGILYLSAIEGDYGNSGYETGSSGDKCYVYYHDEKYLSETLIKNNFSIADLSRKSFDHSSHKSSSHIIIIAEKN